MDRMDAVHQLERLLPPMPHVAAQGSAEEILRHLLVRSGLLREPAVDAVDFVHRTFQDCLGARAAVEERDFDVPRSTNPVSKRPRSDRESEYRGRVHLLAMARLEHAAKLDPGVRTEVERRAGELIPPHSQAEVRELAAPGANRLLNADKLPAHIQLNGASASPS
jgi:hypothetical protein